MPFSSFSLAKEHGMKSGFFQWHSIKTRVTLFTLAIFVLGIWALAFYASRMLQNDMQRVLGEQQFSTVSVIANEIDDSLSDRMQALQTIAQLVTPDVLADTAKLQALLEQRELLKLLFNGGAWVARTDGIAVADVPLSAQRIGTNYLSVDFIAAALLEGKASIGRPKLGEKRHTPVVAIAVPIRDAQNKVIGVLIGVTDLDKPNFLDKIVQSQYGKSGGFLLIAPQHKLIVTATDKSRIMQPVPGTGINAMHDKYMQGYDGFGTTVSSRGVPELTAAKSVPLAGWFVVATLPTQEAFAPIDSMLQSLLLGALFFTVLASALIWWLMTRMLQAQLAPMFSASRAISHLAVSAEPAQTLPVGRQDEIGELIGSFNRLLQTLGQREAALVESEERWKFAIEGVGDGLWDWNIQTGQAFYSRRYKEMLGFTEDEIGSTADEWVKRIHPDDAPVVMATMQPYLDGKAGSVTVEFRMRCKDASWQWTLGRGMVVSRDAAGKVLRMIGTNTDISERKQTETAMRESEARFRTVVEVIPDAIVLHRAGKLVFVNPAAVKMFGAKSAQELIDKPVLELIHPDFHKIVLERVKRGVEQGIAAPSIEEKYIRLDGTVFDAEVQGQPITLAGAPAVLATLRDITERNQAKAKLELAAGVFTHALEGIMITQPDATIIDVNAAFTRITGYSRDDVMGQNPRILSSGRHGPDYYETMWRCLTEQGYWLGEVWNRRKDGQVFAEMQTISTVRDAQGKVQHYVSLFSDITERKEHENQLEHIAHFDALTHLPNRVLLSDRLQQAMVQAQRRGQQLAVAYLDLDGFKTINDHHGHAAGDQVLIALALRMKEVLREGDTLARIGGDEFVAVLIDLEDASACLPLLTRLLAAAAQPVLVNDDSLQVSASLGVTFYPQVHDMDADQLLRQADQSMYQAKVAGKNRYHVFDAVQDSSIRTHHESLERIRLALQQQEFVLHYQPKVNMRSGKVVGAEALIRWQHPENGLLAPAAFLPVIENHPLAVSVGEWVIDQALTQMALWHAAGLHVPVSVNIGAYQLQQANFVESLQAILAAHPQVQPNWLELEVLETSALEDIAQVSQVIEDCAHFGVTFALDDFGTGYSSLTYLKRLRVTLLKIDQSFVRDMLDDPDDLAILQGVIGLAEAFKRDVIAEGVETVAHGTLLLQLGCELAQGYGIARPMPADQLPAWAAPWKPDPAWAELPWLGSIDQSTDV
jgi:diguanylate cyclase (GGDEF)-like protein/PAS domain S-box-containing protein